MPIKQRCYSLKIILIQIQSFLLKSMLSNQLMLVVIWEYKIDSNLNFENRLNSVLSKMTNAIRSLYLVRKQIPLKVIIDVFKTVELSHLFLSEVFLQTHTAKNINCINKQINWGKNLLFSIKICYFR